MTSLQLLATPADVAGRDGGGDEQVDEDEERSGEAREDGVEDKAKDDSERKKTLCMLTDRRSEGILGMRAWIEVGSAAMKSDGMLSAGESGGEVEIVGVDGTMATGRGELDGEPGQRAWERGLSLVQIIGEAGQRRMTSRWQDAQWTVDSAAQMKQNSTAQPRARKT